MMEAGQRTEERWKVVCDDCGAIFTEIYPDGREGDESYSDPADPKPCDCDSQYSLLSDHSTEFFVESTVVSGQPVTVFRQRGFPPKYVARLADGTQFGPGPKARVKADAAEYVGGCEGHPAGPFDAMGVTVYCDGSCRR